MSNQCSCFTDPCSNHQCSYCRLGDKIGQWNKKK